MICEKHRANNTNIPFFAFSSQSEEGAGRQGNGRHRASNESVTLYFSLVFVLDCCVTKWSCYVQISNLIYIRTFII